MSRQFPWRLGQPSNAPFPPAETALRHPDGLLAIGGDLSAERLLNAYTQGAFPWFSQGEPILWWSPDPRTVFLTDGVHLSSRFRRQLKGLPWEVTADTAFDKVIRACAEAPRPGQDGTWIGSDMIEAYEQLHHLGHAHSVEVWDGSELVGGIYGVGVGSMFFGESMFSARSGGSKVALAALADLLHGWGVPLMDAQVENPHLVRMGAAQWPRDRFLAHVRDAVQRPRLQGSWSADTGRFPVQRLIRNDSRPKTPPEHDAASSGAG